MNQSERRQILLRALFDEKPAWRQAGIPAQAGEQKQVLRGLMNVREAAPLSPELLAIQDACRSHGDWRLKHARLYVTLEPCPMCAGGIISARIPEIYYGAKDAGFGACGSILNLFEENFRHHPKIIGHILEDECRQVLQDFFAGVRQKDMQT